MTYVYTKYGHNIYNYQPYKKLMMDEENTMDMHKEEEMNEGEEMSEEKMKKRKMMDDTMDDNTEDDMPMNEMNE